MFQPVSSKNSGKGRNTGLNSVKILSFKHDHPFTRAGLIVTHKTSSHFQPESSKHGGKSMNTRLNSVKELNFHNQKLYRRASLDAVR